MMFFKKLKVAMRKRVKSHQAITTLRREKRREGMTLLMRGSFISFFLLYLHATHTTNCAPFFITDSFRH